MRNIVTTESLPEVIEKLAQAHTLAFDVETTGLSSFHNSKMFSLAISTLDGESYYFNFDQKHSIVLNYQDLKPLMNKERLWIGHNAKFDLHFCEKAGIKPFGRIADTKALARLFESHHSFGGGGYSLDACAKRWLSVEKDDRVKAWMNDNHAFTSTPGVMRRNYHFDLVPFDLISEYAMIDTDVTAQLFLFLKQRIGETPLLDIEIDLTSALFHVERTGVLIDDSYVQAAQNFERSKLNGALIELPSDFKDSAKYLTPQLEERGFIVSQTDKGNDQVDDETLRQKVDSFSKSVLDYRDANKRLNTYWKAYADLTDDFDVIHPDFDQAGTVTGRMSCRNPNLQNIPNRDESEYPVRKAFIARPGFKFVSFDYKAVELRLALEYAGETELIEKIRQGHDPHQATADLTGLTRAQAKTLNFALLYGAGAYSLSLQLGCSEREAIQAKWEYFAGLPKLKSFIEAARNTLKLKGSVTNVFGRKSYFQTFLKNGQRRDNSYKACNLLVQGSAADVIKKAMVACVDLLHNYKSNLILSIHDELVFEIADDETTLIPKLKRLMEEAYAYKLMPLAVSAKIGPNLFDMVECEINPA